MAIIFDPIERRIILDSPNVTVPEIFSRWEDWIAQSDNLKYLPAFRTVGGDGILTGLEIPLYFFLINGWRVRPMEADHTLVIEGNLFVDGGGDPIVPTLGVYRVLVKSVVPMQAQVVQAAQAAITQLDLSNISSAVWAYLMANGNVAEANLLATKIAAQNAFSVSAGQ
jgi:hypothetical protein